MHPILLLSFLLLLIDPGWTLSCLPNSTGYSCPSPKSFSYCDGASLYTLDCPLDSTCSLVSRSDYPCTPSSPDYGQFQSYSCPATCLPTSNCVCASSNPPGGIPKSQMPMMVFLTFDASINPVAWEVFTKIFDVTYRNPTGCKINVTWFIAPQDSSDSLVRDYLASFNFEIGLKSSNDGGSPPIDQIINARRSLAQKANVNEKSILGWRTPNFKYSPSTFAFLQATGFLYDSSITEQDTTPTIPGSAQNKLFPYTLDYGVPGRCQTGVCDYRPGQGRYPGLWEIPVYTFDDDQNMPVFIADPTGDSQQILKMWRLNFNNHYQGNRAPFGLYFTPGWFTADSTRVALLKGFIAELLAMKDVFFVSGTQIVEFMKNPVAVKDASSSPVLNSCAPPAVAQPTTAASVPPGSPTGAGPNPTNTPATTTPPGTAPESGQPATDKTASPLSPSSTGPADPNTPTTNNPKPEEHQPLDSNPDNSSSTYLNASDRLSLVPLYISTIIFSFLFFLN